MNHIWYYIMYNRLHSWQCKQTFQNTSSQEQNIQVMKEEVRRRAGIERELASRADQRVLRWFGHVERMDDYRMARRVLIAGNSVRDTDVSLAGWLVWRWPWATEEWRWRFADNVRKIWKSGDPWYICNWINFKLPFFLALCQTSLPCFGGYHLERGGMPLHDAVWINCKKCATTENQGADVKYMG